MRKKIKTALTIAGSDPSAGAGIQADLKAFSLLKIHGLTVTTCITIQNTQYVKQIHKIPPQVIEDQIDTIFEDITPDAVKTGMLYDKETIQSVAKKILQHNIKPIVDPIIRSTTNNPLYHDKYSFISTFKKTLLPKTYLLTANIPEANALVGWKIKNLHDVEKACKTLHQLGVKNVLIKGGHLPTKQVYNVFSDGKKIHTISLPRIPNKEAHGSGCTISALITGLIALKEKPFDAVKKASYITWEMIRKGYNIGRGADTINLLLHIEKDTPPVPPPDKSNDHLNTWKDLKDAAEKLTSTLPITYIPEVGINIGYATPNAKTLKDIYAVDGRIIKTQDKPIRCGKIAFGCSKHIASIILEATSFNPHVRCAMNIIYSKKNLELCKKAGFTIGTFDRKKEPSDTRSTMKWGTKQVLEKLGFIPDIIYDTGEIGKEPMIRILGKNPVDVVAKIHKLLELEQKKHMEQLK